MELVSGRFPIRVFHTRDLKGSKRCLDGWMLSKCCFLQTGFKLVSDGQAGFNQVLKGHFLDETHGQWKFWWEGTIS